MGNFWFVTYRYDPNSGGRPMFESMITSEHPINLAAQFAGAENGTGTERIVFYAPLTTAELNSDKETQALFQQAMEDYGEIHPLRKETLNNDTNQH